MVICRVNERAAAAGGRVSRGDITAVKRRQRGALCRRRYPLIYDRVMDCLLLLRFSSFGVGVGYYTILSHPTSYYI